MIEEADLRPRRWGVLDIGSNSVRLVIYDISGAAFSPIYNEKVLAGLGRSLRASGRLDPDGCEAGLAALSRFTLIAKGQGVEKLLIGATAALREASDAPQFIADVKAKTGLDITPISGAEEARLSAMGLMSALPGADGLAADLGGASLELIPLRRGRLSAGETFPLGPFKMLGKDQMSAPLDVKALQERIDMALAGKAFEKGRKLYLIGGAWRNLAKLHQIRTDYPLRTLQAYALPPKNAEALARWAMSPGGQAEILASPVLSSRRAETLPYSAVLLEALLERLAPSEIIISTTGLREGLIYDALGPDIRARSALHDGCRDLARGNLQEPNFADPLYEFLKDASQDFPRAFSESREDALRKAACLLAGMGKGLHPAYRAELVFEDVLYAPLSGLTHSERAFLALTLYRSFTSRAEGPNDGAIERLLSPDQRRAAEIYGLAIRLAIVASGRSPDLLEAFTLKIENGKAALTVAPQQAALMSARVKHRLKKFSQKLSGL